MSWKAHRFNGGSRKYHTRQMARRVKHHILNRVDGGSDYDYNLLMLWNYKERTFHDLFGNRTLRESARLLLRVARAKERQRKKVA